MSEKKDLYGLLDVSNTASDEEIKKAYRKMALKYHPDRNPNNKEEANTKFQEINKAFQTLNNPEKRKRYDKFGVIEGENNEGGPGNMPPGFNPFDLFSNMFGGSMPGSGMPGMPGFGSQDMRRNAKSPDKKVTINISLTDVYMGKVIPIDFTKNICCDKCEGNGANSKDSIKTCNVCNGQGKVVKMMQMGPMIQQSIQNCNACGSNGKIIPPGCQCAKCNGKKCVSIKRHVDCYIRPGTTAGTHITFKNESDWMSDFGDVGDLVVFVNCKNEEGMFRREADNLIMKKSITLLEALTSTEFMFKHLDGRVIKVAHDEIIKPNQTMLIKREGMPNLQDNLHKGDMIVHFDVIFPDNLEKERSKYLVKILPTVKKQIWDMQLENTPANEITHHTLELFKTNDTFKNNNNTNNNTNNDTKNNPHTQTQNEYEDDDADIFNQFNKGGGIPGMGNPIECATQ
jgi:DnaJ-class molecular chaperone